VLSRYAGLINGVEMQDTASGKAPVPPLELPG